MPARAIDADQVRAPGEERLSVARPFEPSSRPRRAGPPSLSTVVRPHEVDPTGTVDVGEQAFLTRSPRRRHRGDAPCDEAIALPVPAHDAERIARPVRNPESRPGKPAGVRERLWARDSPAHVPVRLERDELVSARRGHEEPTRRPRRPAVVAEAALRAVRANHPDALLRGNEQVSGRGQRVERGACVGASGDDILDPATDRASGRCERHGPEDGGRGEEGCRDEPPAMPIDRQGLACLPGGPNDPPASPLRLELVGRVDGEELLTKFRVVHGPAFGP